MEEKTFDTGEVRLHVMESPPGAAPDGPPLLLLHALFSKWREFSVLVPGLETRGRVWAPDLRGHGQSGRAASYRIESFVPDIASLIRGRIRRPAVVFGHSLGGMIALLLGAAHPELVEALVIGESLISVASLREFSAASREQTRWWREIAKLGSAELVAEELRNELIPVPGRKEPAPARQVLGENSPAFRFFAECLSQLDPAVFEANIEGWEESYAAYRPDELFPGIDRPVLLLQGRRELGAAMTDEDVRRALALLPRGRHAKIEKAGHLLHLQDREGVLKAVARFLDENPALEKG